MKEYVQQGGALLVTVGEGGEAAFGSALGCNLRPTPRPGARSPDPFMCYGPSLKDTVPTHR